MTKRVYRVSPVCEREGHVWDEGSVPTCMRDGCDEGLQTADYYCWVMKQYPPTEMELAEMAAYAEDGAL